MSSEKTSTTAHPQPTHAPSPKRQMPGMVETKPGVYVSTSSTSVFSEPARIVRDELNWYAKK